MTFFFRHMRSLIERGHLYLAQPPLYLVRKNKSKTYLKNEKELEKGQLPDNPFKQMPDRTIFRSLLKPGQRSALFISTSPVNSKLEKHHQDFRIAFFYINAGSPNDPAIARVETPFWVASDPIKLGQLHAAIWAQCQAPGRYPYVLARAHEVAVVTTEQRHQLENMLASAMLSRGLNPQASAKSVLKSLTA